MGLLFSKDIQTMDDLLLHGLQDIYYAENQIVKSLPKPTLRPGCTLVPHWRTMMLPARTISPPNFLIPRYCGLLSRPFREEPTPFL